MLDAGRIDHQAAPIAQRRFAHQKVTRGAGNVGNDRRADPSGSTGFAFVIRCRFVPVAPQQRIK